jgi:hypothetical protein
MGLLTWPLAETIPSYFREQHGFGEGVFVAFKNCQEWQVSAA